MYNTLKQITLVHGVSGKEHRVANTLKEMIAPYCDEAHIDALGNLIAVKHGNGKAPKKKSFGCEGCPSAAYCSHAACSNESVKEEG